MNERVVHRVVHEERGAVALTIALAFPFFVAFMAIVLTAGDWWVHKRHLQTQADAAALASAQGFGFPCSGAQTRVENLVADWGGVKNVQVENTQGNVHFVVNKPGYYAGGTADDTPNQDPCVSKMVDVKATETGLKGPIGVGLIPNINAHARVEFFQALALNGMLPVAVPEPAPKHVRAYFVDETTGTTIAERELSKNGKDANGNAIWDNTALPLNVNVGTHDRIGVRVALSGQTSTTCGQPLVDCYDSGSANGLAYVRGWTNNGTVQVGNSGTAPLARSVTLSSSTCPDPYFSTGATCNVAVRADVDFGTGATNDPTANAPTGRKAALRAVVNGTNYNMSWSGGHWTSTESIPVTAGGGPTDIGLQWAVQAPGSIGGAACATTGQPFANGNPCKGTISNVQRTFAGGDSRSGPIKLVQVLQGGVAGANSLHECDSGNTSCTYPLVVKLAIQGTLENARSVNDPLVTLRTGDSNQPGTIDCDPAISNLKDEVAKGCGPQYTPNNGTACPSSQSALWSSPQPWNCVAVTNGTATNQIATGLNDRILGADKPTSCTSPNLYVQDFGNWDPSDPRIVQLLLAPFGSFSGTGNTTVPVTGFATFYITGWEGQGAGFSNPCAKSNGGTDDDPGGKGNIVGHFITYVQTQGGTPSPNACDENAITTCLGVLTR